jgi:8-oxo-dGTP pyrophosphatase MutT (NUDIX family)
MAEIVRATGVIFVCQDRALFLQRSLTGDHAGEFCWPGGGIEDGESASEAAARECVEEIGQMPKGTMVLHDRRISPTISKSASAIEEDGIPLEPQVDFTTFVVRVKAEFEPKLNEEHIGYAWAPLANPPQPIHPGCARSIAKFTMNDYDIAQEMMSGGLTSPQQFMNIWLFDMRITGTGMSFRAKHDEYVMRDPSIYLNEYFLARCNGLPVIVEHPPNDTLDTAEYRERNIGTIVLPYIKGNEVWGIAKIYDAAAAAMLTDPEREVEYSTSPAVVFRKSDGNTEHFIDGQKILVEGPPSNLDHLAVCRVGVWDKGGAPNGIVSTRGDSDVNTKADDGSMLSMMDAFKADMAKFADSMKDCVGKMDAHSKRMDAAEDEDKKKADAAKAKADADEKERADAKAKADAAKKADADEDDDKKADAKAKADAEDEEKKKADAKAKADADEEEKKKADAARADAILEHPTVKAMQAQLAELRARIPANHLGDDKAAFGAAQAKADAAYTAHGERAPGPLLGETLGDYRRRLASGQKVHSERLKEVDLTAMADDNAFGMFEEMVYSDSLTASRNPDKIPLGVLVPIKKLDSTGMREIVEYKGKPESWMAAFMSQNKASSTQSMAQYAQRHH